MIGDDRLAVFELVKNGYDADATQVSIVVDLRSRSEQSIVVQDNGTGMTLADITGKWLELATDSRRKDRTARSKRFRRLALGEKGVGRIASLKLGRYVTLTTRAAEGPEHEVRIDWDALVAQGPYLEDLAVVVNSNSEPRHFADGNTGTRIEISGLRRQDWTRGDLRRLYRLVTSLASPFQTPDQFQVNLSAPGREWDVADLVSPNEFLDLAVWKFTFSLSGRNFDWSYSFNPPHWKGIEPRTENRKQDRLMLSPQWREQDATKPELPYDSESLLLRDDGLIGIGPIVGSIYVYYRRTEVMNATGNSSQVKSWLDDQTGVRVYRDGVRVFTYGEGADDWLGLNVRRINTPAGKLGTNSVVAAIHLSLNDSLDLREKTNREGFDQNAAFERLRGIVLSVFEHLERLHAEDRQKLDNAVRGPSDVEKPRRFAEAMQNLRTGLKTHNLDQAFARDVNAIEHDFVELRDVMTSAGMAGLNLAVIFHEVEREVESLAKSVERGMDSGHVREQIEHLHQLLQGFAPLLRRSPSRLSFVGALIRAAVRTREPRFRFHEVQLEAPITTGQEADFKVRGPANLLTGALGNLLDNALYWSRFRRERDERADQAAVAVRCAWDSDTRTGMIAVIDNGPGFSVPESRAVQAFVTTRPGGMGLGLYFANLVMEQLGGQLTVHAASDLRDELEFPVAFDGAAVVMRFSALP